MGKGRPSVLQPLQHSTFRNIWIANFVSSFGALIQGVGAAWMMTALTNSVDLVALVQASTSLPIMLFSLLGGAIADNFPRRRVMLVAQFFMLAVSALLTVTALMGLITPMAVADLHFSDWLRHGPQQPVLASLGGRHGATIQRRPGGGAKLYRLQPVA